MVRRLIPVVLPVLLAGCTGYGSDAPVIPEPSWPAARPAPSGGMLGGGADLDVPAILASGTFGTAGPDAVTYDPRIVPAGATARVAVGRVGAGISVRLSVSGMLPRRTYGAHLHTKPCTAAPAGSGPHYQHEPAPPPAPEPSASGRSAPAKPGPAKPGPATAKPSPSPAGASAAAGPDADPYANPRNEVWLDFTADRTGAATSTAVQGWTFDEAAPPRSLVVHLTATRTGPGVAGTAGARVACLTLPG